jgi:hypothetical protein
MEDCDGKEISAAVERDNAALARNRKNRAGVDVMSLARRKDGAARQHETVSGLLI